MKTHRTPFSGVFAVVLAYALFAGLWILLSDRAMGLLFSDPELLVRVSMAKGWLFVAVTSLLLYLLVRQLVGKLDQAHRRELDYLRQQREPPPMLVAIADSSGDAIFAKDEQGRYLLFNEAAARIVGKPAAEVIGHDDRVLFPPAQAERIMAIDRQVRECGQPQSNEEVLRTAAGERVFLVTKGPLRGVDGRIFGSFGISRDITERKRDEEALRERDHRLSAIVNNSPSALTLKYPDGRYALANPNMQRIHHMTEAEIIGKTDFDLYPEATARTLRNNDRLVLESKARHSIEEIVPVDGVPRTYMSHMFPVFDDAGKVELICRISLDITERKQAADDQQRLVDDLTATLQAIPDLMFEIDSEGRYLKVKAENEALLAAPTAQLLGRTVAEILPAEAAATVMAAVTAAGRNGTDYGRAIVLPLPEGPRHFELSVARKPVTDAQREQFVVLSRDITSRKLAELELRQRNDELERFNRAATDRELRMIALKREVNAMARAAGRPAPYDTSFADQPDGAGAP